MKISIILSAAVMAVALSACDRPTAVVTPAVVTVPTPVPGPPGPAGATGATGEPGKSRDTVIVVPPAEAPPAR